MAEKNTTEKKEETLTLTKAELQKLIEEQVAALTEEKKKAAPVPASKERFVLPAPEPEMVKIRLFKDNGRYKEPVFVAVNGRTYMVPRGVEVEVPDFVKEVLDNSARQDEETDAYIRGLEDDFEEKSKAV